MVSCALRRTQHLHPGFPRIAELEWVAVTCHRSSTQITADCPVFQAVDAIPLMIHLMIEPVIIILGSRESRLTCTEPLG